MEKGQLPIDEDPSIPIEGALFPLEFTKEETEKIIKACKSRSVTVHGALHTAESTAFTCLLQGDEVKSSLTLHLYNYVINVRFLIDTFK